MELVTEKYKQTEAGLIPSDWCLVKFKDISFMKGRIGWQGLNQTEFTNNSEEPFLITGMNFKNGEIRWNEVYHVSNERYEVAKEIQLKINDVLMTKDGTIGKLLFVNDIPYPYKATLNSHLLVFRPLKNSYNPKYLYYNLASPYFDKHIELTKSGTTFFGVSQTSVGEYNIVLPPIEEQTAIAVALSDADNWINSLDQIIIKKRLIKQGTMQELLKPKKGWEVKKLGELITYRNGKSFENDIVENGDYNLITLNSIDIKGKLKSDHWKVKTFDNSLEKGDLIIVLSDVAHGNFLGLTDIIPENNKYVLNQRMGALKDLKGITSEFLSFYLNNNQAYFKMSGKGSSQQNLGKDDILNFEIALPKKEEQIYIADILSDMDAEITKLEVKLEKAKQLKLGMMQELLTGRIRLV
jgi:type I restriction enzyme S subunit